MGEKITKFFGPYRFLSNFWPCVVLGRGNLLYFSVEAAYQAAKPPYTEVGEFWVRRIQEATTPGLAKKFGGKCPLGDHWTAEFKVAVMHSLLIQKFSDLELGKALVETGDAEIIEGNTWGDTFWGRCGGVGENHLGELLMRIREGLRGDQDAVRGLEEGVGGTDPHAPTAEVARGEDDPPVR